MDIQKYRAFLGAVDAGNFTKAGETLGYTQSGMSHMMKSLEAKMGFALFNRSSTGITLNADGKRLLPAIRELVQCGERLDQIIAEIKGVEIGDIRIGTFSSISTHWLPCIIREFQANHPKININLYEGGIREVENWLDEGIVEIGFLSRQPHHAFDWIPLKEDPLLAVLPKDTPLAAGRAFPLAAFQGKPFIMSDAGFDDDIHRVLEQNGVVADIKFSSQDDYAIVSMVRNGLGLSILPELVLQWSAHHVLTTELEPRAWRSLGIATPAGKSLSPAAEKFIGYADRILRREGLLEGHSPTLMV